jgi:DHA2 family methylenomycin A resistance protein-like MFS transporter
VAVPVAAVLSGRLTSHRGPRITMIAGLVLGAAGLLGLIVTARGTPYWVLVLPMVAGGSGMALTMPAATTAVMDAAPGNRSGTAAGLINTARQVGGALGVAVAGSLVSGAIGFVPGLHVALAVCGGAFLLGAVVTAATVGRNAATAGRNRAGREPAKARSGGTGGLAEAFGQGAQDGDELGRVEDLEVEALDGGIEGEFLEGV